MEFKVGNPCTKNEHKNEFKLSVYYTEEEYFKIFTKDKELLELLIETYDHFKENSRISWGDHFAPQYKDIKEFFTSVKETLNSNFEIDKDFIDEYWARSRSFNGFAIYSSYALTYFDEFGIEHYVAIS